MPRWLLVIVLLACPGFARASDGVVELSWNACAPIVQNLSTTTPGVYSAYASVRGFDSSHVGYLVEVVYGNIVQTVPDAWRFDATGCHGSSAIQLDHLAPAEVAANCPSLVSEPPANTLFIKDVSFNPPSSPQWPTTNMRMLLAVVYRPGVAAADPTKRYFLARFLFDHTNSVAGNTVPGLSCGGLQQSMCFKLSQAQYLSQDEVEHSFGREGGPTAIPTLSVNSPAACAGATPATPTTWGSIRGAYR